MVLGVFLGAENAKNSKKLSFGAFWWNLEVFWTFFEN
jgi:hypothetical protein